MTCDDVCKNFEVPIRVPTDPNQPGVDVCETVIGFSLCVFFFFCVTLFEVLVYLPCAIIPQSLAFCATVAASAVDVRVFAF